MNRNGSIEYARFLGALGIVWFHMKMPGGTTALAALQLFILLQVYFGAERALSPQARRLLVPWLLRLKFQVQHPEPEGRRMLRWTDEASISAARSAA
jgi:hypothetical protein